jgi:signal transduction histidine kinase
MASNALIWIFFVYGLAFFCMGLAILLEIGHVSDRRLEYALRFLAAFGLVHGTHEWMEMFQLIGISPLQALDPEQLDTLRVLVLALSFLALAAFGAALLFPGAQARRASVWIPLAGLLVWSAGMLALGGRYPAEFWQVADAWTRYSLAIPAALLACAGLLAQRRVFAQAGMAEFGQDSLWAAIAFAWYGAVGQAFASASGLPPSNLINSQLFLSLFGFPVQLVRAAAAVAVAIFVVRFLRSAEVEVQRHIAELQSARLQEAQQRDAMRGELLRRVVEAQEAERQRIARELHDDTGQSLTAIGMGLRGAISTLPRDPRRAGGQLTQIEALLTDALSDLQRLIANLRPSHLDDLGLPAALRWYAGELTARSGVQVAVEISGDASPLPDEVTTALFRITQEALNNTVKHARSEHADVRLEYLADFVTLMVCDRGVGFNPAAVRQAEHPPWGLLGMQERAVLLGGQLAIDSSPGKGTCVTVIIPRGPTGEVEHADTSLAG